MENGDQADQVSHLGFRFRPTKKNGTNLYRYEIHAPN